MRGPQEEGTSSRLEDIATRWDIVRDPLRFVHRYGPAVQRYFRALIHNHHDAEEAAQEFFLRVAQTGFYRVREEGGRFRDYLRTSVRNAALNFLRRGRGPHTTTSELLLLLAPANDVPHPDQQWAAEWRQCLLNRALQALRQYQNRNPGNLSHMVLTLVAEHPQEDTRTLAERTAVLIGRPFEAAAFRKQVSRARRMLARLLVEAVTETLDTPTEEQVQEELIDLSLWEYVRDYLRDDPD